MLNQRIAIAIDEINISKIFGELINLDSPLIGSGQYYAPSLLSPLEAVFEAYVEKQLSMKLEKGCILKA
ncbi:hypothetical protein R5L37_19360 [Acinetobacter pittii]|uniref:hypothetical protein n=1 Tax=Acinetobacter pittii TaxID=48296 RepID=UPI0029536DDF|nr:hypothetical protein [Acinetobacter pittii]MDV8153896.1 hypothetical protein [Acinetobacter pittii]